MANDGRDRILEDLNHLAAETREYEKVEMLRDIVKNRNEGLVLADLNREEEGALRWLLDERVGKPYLQPCLDYVANIVIDMVSGSAGGSN